MRSSLVSKMLNKFAALEAYLDACKERIDDRLNRNVMGDLKERKLK